MNCSSGSRFYSLPILFAAVFSFLDGATGLQSHLAQIAGGLRPIAVGILGLSFLVLVHELGHWVVARFFGMGTPIFCVGYGKREWCLVLGTAFKTEFRIAPFLLGGGFVRITGTNEKAFDDFPLWQRIVVATAGIFANIVSATVMLFVVLHCIGSAQVRVTSTYVNALSDQVSIARDAGILPQDTFVSVGDCKIINAADLARSLQINKGKTVKVELQRNGKEVSATVTPTDTGDIGVIPGQYGEGYFIKVPVKQAAYFSVSLTIATLASDFQEAGKLVGIVKKPAGAQADSRLLGMIGIVQLAANSASKGLFDFLLFLFLMNLNLAFLNILPIPIFDGGRILYCLIEAIIGRPVSRAVRMKLGQVFLVSILALTCWGLLSDLRYLFG